MPSPSLTTGLRGHVLTYQYHNYYLQFSKFICLPMPNVQLCTYIINYYLICYNIFTYLIYTYFLKYNLEHELFSKDWSIFLVKIYIFFFYSYCIGILDTHVFCVYYILYNIIYSFNHLYVTRRYPHKLS